MIAMNYGIHDANDSPLPSGTDLTIAVMGDGFTSADRWVDPTNPGRVQLKFSKAGPATVRIDVPGFGYKIFTIDIPEGGGEATVNNPIVLIPLS